jgi:hypothetical protein
VVDGKVGFTGGVGIADIWTGNAESPEHWRDTHFRASGPVVAQLQSAFVDNWVESGGELLHGDKYFPELRATGSYPAQAFKGSPEEATENVELMYRLAIAAAEHSIKLSSAYFVPNDGTIKALQDAAGRGVEIQIITPGEHLDSELVQVGSPALWGELLKAGVKIYQYEPTMFHCKVLVIDDYFSSLGSTNFDNRSFQLNDEVNLNVFDERFSSEQSRIFDEDAKRSKLVTYEDWKQRPWYQKAMNWLALPFRRELQERTCTRLPKSAPLDTVRIDPRPRHPRAVESGSDATLRVDEDQTAVATEAGELLHRPRRDCVRMFSGYEQIARMPREGRLDDRFAKAGARARAEPIVRISAAANQRRVAHSARTLEHRPSGGSRRRDVSCVIARHRSHRAVPLLLLLRQRLLPFGLGTWSHQRSGLE